MIVTIHWCIFCRNSLLDQAHCLSVRERWHSSVFRTIKNMCFFFKQIHLQICMWFFNLVFILCKNSQIMLYLFPSVTGSHGISQWLRTNFCEASFLGHFETPDRMPLDALCHERELSGQIDGSNRQRIGRAQGFGDFLS